MRITFEHVDCNDLTVGAYEALKVTVDDGAPMLYNFTCDTADAKALTKEINAILTRVREEHE